MDANDDMAVNKKNEIKEIDWNYLEIKFDYEFAYNPRMTSEEIVYWFKSHITANTEE